MISISLGDDAAKLISNTCKIFWDLDAILSWISNFVSNNNCRRRLLLRVKIVPHPKVYIYYHLFREINTYQWISIVCVYHSFATVVVKDLFSLKTKHWGMNGIELQEYNDCGDDIFINRDICVSVLARKYTLMYNLL